VFFIVDSYVCEKKKFECVTAQTHMGGTLPRNSVVEVHMNNNVLIGKNAHLFG